jgi:FixJ family two-component response regulator
MSGAKRTSLVAVVDDDELLRDALRRLLKASGLGAVSFESAEDLLNSGRLPEIACLIADVRMPGMSGLELQARLKAERCPIPIIFITAHGDAKMRIQAMRDGAVEFLTKPFDNAVLLEMVRAAIKVNSVRFLGANG